MNRKRKIMEKYAKKRKIRSVSLLAAVMAGLLAVLVGLLVTLQVAHLDPDGAAVSPPVNADPPPDSDGPPPPINPVLIDKELKQRYQEMDEGRVAYKPNEEVTQGIPEVVTVRISGQPDADIFEGLDGRESIVVEEVKVGGSMSAYLTGAPDDFVITQLSSTRQAIVGPYSDWKWRVMSLKSGKKVLNLRITATIYLSNGKEETKDVIVKDTEISVKVNPRWILAEFWREYWQWILGSPLGLGILAWVWTYLKKKASKKSRKAGF